MDLFSDVFIDSFSSNKTCNFQMEQNKNFNPYIIFVIITTITTLLLKNKALEKQGAVHLFVATVALILSPILLGLILIFVLYRQGVNLILKAKLGSKFGGLLEGTDAFWAIEDASKSIINVLMIIQFDNSPDDFYSTIRKTVYEKCFKSPYRLPKLLVTYHKAFGYYYMINDELTLDDCVTTLEISSDKNDIDKNVLLDILSKYSNVPLPKSHKAFWQVLIGQKTVQWKDDCKKYYPLVFRVHHSLADGVSLLKTLKEIFADKLTTEHCNQITKNKYLNNRKLINQIVEKWTSYTNTLRLLLIAPIVMFKQIARGEDRNILHGPILSGQKILAMKVEDSAYCIEQIKQIRNKIPGSTFSDVLFTAIAKSFGEYYQKNLPDTALISAAVPAYPKIDVNLSSDIALNNRFSVAALDLPLSFHNESFIEALKRVKKKTQILKNSNDYQINYWFLSIASALLPESILRQLSAQCTLIISNLPGPTLTTVFNGCLLKDVIFWAPHRGATGIAISIFSYDGRLQIGISADEALITNKQNVVCLVDAIYKNLSLMESEVECYFNGS